MADNALTKLSLAGQLGVSVVARAPSSAGVFWYF